MCVFKISDVQMNIEFRKTGFKREYSRFLMYKYKKLSVLFRKKTITTYLKAKNSLHATQISSFKKQMLKYTLNIFFVDFHIRNRKYK